MVGQVGELDRATGVDESPHTVGRDFVRGGRRGWGRVHDCDGAAGQGFRRSGGLVAG